MSKIKKKSKKELLVEFKKANIERRKRIAYREGYDNTTNYLNYLVIKKK